MIAIVTDRPNVGREIARVLGADRKENGYMTGNGYMVTWTYGNMLSLAMPKDSGTAHVEWKDFPLLPPSFLTDIATSMRMEAFGRPLFLPSGNKGLNISSSILVVTRL